MKQKIIEYNCDAVLFDADSRSCAFAGRVLGKSGLKCAIINSGEVFTQYTSVSKKFDFSEIFKYTMDSSQNDQLLQLAYCESVKYIFCIPKGKICDVSDITMFLFRRFCSELSGVDVFYEEQLLLKDKIIAFAIEKNLGYDFINWLSMTVTFYPMALFFDAYESYCEEDISAYVEANKPIPLFNGFKDINICADLSDAKKLKKLQDATVFTCASYAMLHDIEFMFNFVSRPRFNKFLTAVLHEEIAPFIDVNFEQKQVFILSMLRRFSDKNLPIKFAELNDIAKTFAFNTAQIIRDFFIQNQVVPKRLAFSVYCLIEAYKTFNINDEFSSFIKESTSAKILKNEAVWGSDMSFLADELAKFDDLAQQKLNS